jgi:hypothetical protein
MFRPNNDESFTILLKPNYMCKRMISRSFYRFHIYTLFSVSSSIIDT